MKTRTPIHWINVPIAAIYDDEGNKRDLPDGAIVIDWDGMDWPPPAPTGMDQGFGVQFVEGYPGPNGGPRLTVAVGPNPKPERVVMVLTKRGTKGNSFELQRAPDDLDITQGTYIRDKGKLRLATNEELA